MSKRNDESERANKWCVNNCNYLQYIFLFLVLTYFILIFIISVIDTSGTNDDSCKCSACILGTAQVDVRTHARCIFLCVDSSKQLLSLAALVKYVCGINEGAAETSDYSPAFGGLKLAAMEYFGILNKTHARQDMVVILISKLLTAQYLEEYFVEITDLDRRQQRKALRITSKGLDCFVHPEKSVFITCIK